MVVEVVVLIVAASIAGGLSMGAVSWIYFLDKWRTDPEKPSAASDPVARGEHARR